MKTTVGVFNELLSQAKDTCQTLCAAVERGLRRVLALSPSGRLYRLPDLRVGNPTVDDPLERYAWPELRDTIYDDRLAE